MPNGANPAPPAEVVAALANMALLVVGLAVLVVATRAMQMSFDKKQAERARTEAIQASQHRLKTLSERNIFYQSSTATAPQPYGLQTAGSSPLDDCAFGSGASSGAASPDSDLRELTGILCGSSCPTPPTVAGGASGSSGTWLLLAATSSLLKLRPSSLTLGSGVIRGAGDAGNPPRAPLLDRSRSLNGHHSGTELSGLVLGGSGGGGSRGGRPALLHKNSDSFLETSRVLSSVPQETITSTRQVLAAFNYDYSALYRRESSYVSGNSPWSRRAKA